MIYENSSGINITKVKSDISELVGKKVMLKRSFGRDRGYEKVAVIEKIYPSLFKVKFEQNDFGESYSYSDILTRTVEVSVYNGVGYNPLLPPLELKKKKLSRVNTNVL